MIETGLITLAKVVRQGLTNPWETMVLEPSKRNVKLGSCAQIQVRLFF